ncbi:MAG TPA: alkaline phosphatase family protein [Gemmatimonadales bacterium]
MKLGRTCSAFLVLAMAACVSGPPGQPVPEAPGPSLVVFITVDQLRADYLDRFRSQLQGGLARLMQGGAVFTDAHQDHAITETAPGHASTMSGRFPRSTGITRNVAGVPDPGSPLIGATDLGASPIRFRGTTLTDWLTAADPRTRALSVSAKDRGAILPIGRSKRPVFWYANNGTFTTSRYYADTLPTWVQAFNARRLLHRKAGQAWTLLLGESNYTERDSVPLESGGRNFTFPHRLPADSAAAAANARYTPFMDELTAGFALQGVRAMDLGRGPATDVLAVSFSATDYVGHFYGPESRELHDQILRLDRVLGAFIDTLYTLRDSTRIVFVLTADHGVAPIPELHGALRVSVGPAMAAAQEALRAAGGDTSAVDLESGALFIDPGMTGRASVDQIAAAFMAAALKIPGVLRVDRFADLAARDTARDEIARRWLQMFPDDMLPVAVVTLAPGNMYNYSVTATHGSPHRHDSHVPIVFYGPPFRAGSYSRFVRTVDIAPTLARALGVTPSERLDGRVLTEALGR